jgi:signal transduction histidine kinase
MLDINRLEHHDYLAEFAETNLNEVVAKIVQKMRPLATNKNLILNLKLAPNIAIVDLDNLQFETILTNLIDNAIRFTPAEGVINISVQMHETEFDVAVQDNGIGLSEDEQKRVFDKFYQDQNPFDRKHGGVGLGLSIAKEMAAVCGGTILLKSSLGQGAVFTYRQPIKIIKHTGHKGIIEPSPNLINHTSSE